MRWILGAAAAALLFATQAGAATINGPDEVVQGQVYTLTFDTGAVTVEGKPNYFEMDLLLPTKKITFSGALFRVTTSSSSTGSSAPLIKPICTSQQS